MVNVAKQVVRTSLNLTDQDVLGIDCWSHVTGLASEIAAEAYKVGADAQISYLDDRLWRSWFEMDEKYIARKSPISAALAETITAYVSLSGPEDPSVFDRSKPERMAKADPWIKEINDRQRERKVRSLFLGRAQVTPARARKYGVNFAKWKRIVNASLGADLKPIAAHGRLVSKKLGGASDVQILGEGTDLSLSLRGREAILEDGIVDASDIARGHLQSSLPSGFVDIAPLETTGDGDVTFPSTPLWGKMIRNLRVTFSGGRLVDYQAAKNVGAFANYFKASSGEKDRIASLTIGLNPTASYLGGFVDHFVAGAVTIGLGGNQDIGGPPQDGVALGGALQEGTGAGRGRRIRQCRKPSSCAPAHLFRPFPRARL